MKAYKGGGYHRIYGTAVAEIKECIANLDNNIPAVPLLSWRLREKQDYFFGTYAEKVVIPDKFSVLNKPLYRAAGITSGITGMETRLRRTKKLISKSEAEKEIKRSLKLRDSIFGGISIERIELADKSRRLTARKEYENALYANSAFKNLIDRKATGHEIPKLLKEGYLMISTGQIEFSKENANWLYHGGKGKVFEIRDLTQSEDMYFKDEVSLEESLKINGIPLRVQFSNTVRKYVTTSKVGLYKINEDMLTWAENLCNRLKAESAVQRPIPQHKLLHIFSQDREWVNDDTNLISQAIELTKTSSDVNWLGLVSLDKRLANQMSITTNTIVCLIDPSTLPGTFPDKDFNSTLEISNAELSSKLPESVKWRLRSEPIKVLIDTGSLSSSLAKLEREDIQGSSFIIERELLGVDYETQTKKISLKDSMATTRLRVKIYDPKTKNRFRRSSRYDIYHPSRSDLYNWSSGSERSAFSGESSS
jgi:hypothetical protein